MQNIILIGMPGVGKTCIGNALALRLNQQFIDLDKSIEARYGVDIATIFAIEGEEGFRQRESDELNRLLKSEIFEQKGIILSLGGGTISIPNNRNMIKQINGTIIWLDSDIDILADRIAKSSHKRPSFNKDTDIKQKLLELAKLRHEQYEQFADYTLNTSHLRVKQIVQKVLQVVNITY